jgi:hypothetical protein
MKSIIYTFEIWTILSFVGLILIYFRRDAHIINEDWKSVKSKRNPVHLFFTIFLVFLILPFSIPYSLAHFRKN